MATIVLHRPTKKRYVLVGSGFGALQPPRPSVSFGALPKDANIEDLVLLAVAGTQGVMAVCGPNGEIGWLPSDELAVLEVDGKPPQLWLHPPDSPYR